MHSSRIKLAGFSNSEESGIEKVCKICGVKKPLSDFSKLKAARDGHGQTCLACCIALYVKRAAGEVPLKPSEIRMLDSMELGRRYSIYSLVPVHMSTGKKYITESTRFILDVLVNKKLAVCDTDKYGTGYYTKVDAPTIEHNPVYDIHSSLSGSNRPAKMETATIPTPILEHAASEISADDILTLLVSGITSKGSGVYQKFENEQYFGFIIRKCSHGNTIPAISAYDLRICLQGGEEIPC